MRWLSRFTSWLHGLSHRQEKEQELDQEVSSYLNLLTEEKISSGMAPDAARRSANLELGGVEQIKEQVRDVRAGVWLETVLQDVRYGVRVLRNNPGFSLLVVLTLALGIGANTAIFSVVYGVLLRPLPYAHGGQVVVVHQRARGQLADIPFSYKEVVDYREQTKTLDSVVEYHSMYFLLLGNDSAERVRTAVVSANFFDVLGVKALLGRTFVASDESQNADAVLVMSYQYWQSHQGGDANIIGKVFQMNNRPHTVIGVLPPVPQYPAENDVYMPTSQCPFRSSQAFMANRTARMMTVFGRLKPTAALATAQADLSTIASRIESANPDVYPKGDGYGVAVAPLQEDLTRRARSTLLVLLGAAGFVLLIACANVANLMLARLLKRERELAVRSALGATRARLVRQLLTETMLLSLAGGVLGLELAYPTLSLLVKFAARFTTRANEVRVDGVVLAFTLGVSVVSGLLFGFVPALSSRERVSDALKQGTGQATSSRGRERLRAGLVVLQIAISFMLLIAAGLMIRSFEKLLSVDPGFSPERVLTLNLSPNFSRYTQTAQFVALGDNILRSVRAVGGVESAALASNFPFSPLALTSGPGSVNFDIEGRSLSNGDLQPRLDANGASPGYFETIRQPLLRGRTFTDHDDANAMKVVIINQAMALHRFSSEDPLGKRISFDGGKTWITIVGVVGDAREYGLEHPAGDEVYLPVDQTGFGGSLLVRTTVDPMSMVALLRKALHDVDLQLAVDQVQTIEDLQHESVASPRITTILLGIFAGLALLISASGIAGIMALTVSQRTRELGIRMALGQSKRSVVRMVVRQGLIVALAGTALGLIGAMAVGRLLSSLLYATSPTDISTFAAVSLLFIAVAALACFVPARRVTLIDPFIALRQE
ncbi:MAG TPA: ABC transporter permease [Terriglobales bacterium]|nr:ABC transporter permease [Terriglobales bacterium]